MQFVWTSDKDRRQSYIACGSSPRIPETLCQALHVLGVQWVTDRVSLMQLILQWSRQFSPRGHTTCVSFLSVVCLNSSHLCNAPLIQYQSSNVMVWWQIIPNSISSPACEHLCVLWISFFALKYHCKAGQGDRMISRMRNLRPTGIKDAYPDSRSLDPNFYSWWMI